MRIHPSHFNQLAGPKAPQTGGCDDIWDQDDREELARTIAEAEELIANELGFWPSPKFITDEEIQFGLMGVRSDWQNAEVDTNWAHVQVYGVEVLTLIQADASVVYTDDDNDKHGREELATIGEKTGELYGQPITSDCDECEVAVFFRVADGAEDAADPRWEIKPLKVDVDAGVLYITAESSMFVKPSLWKTTKVDDPDDWKHPFDTDNLVQFVDLYCRTVDMRTPVTVKWDGVCSCTSPCSHYTQLACAYVTDWKRGFFVPRLATWNGTTHVDAYADYTGVPESLVVNYRAGYPLDKYCTMNRLLERAIVKLTNVLLPEPPCGYCDAAQTRWKSDRANIDPLTPEAASMPWAMYQQGALEAWRIVKRLKMGQGGKLGR